jgi:hypothetical protein
MIRHDHELRLADWFCGAGGSTQAIGTIPAVRRCMHSCDDCCRLNVSSASC